MSKKKATTKNGAKIKRSLPAGFAAFKHAQQTKSFQQFRPNVSTLVRPKFGKRGDR